MTTCPATHSPCLPPYSIVPGGSELAWARAEAGRDPGGEGGGGSERHRHRL